MGARRAARTREDCIVLRLFGRLSLLCHCLPSCAESRAENEELLTLQVSNGIESYGRGHRFPQPASLPPMADIYPPPTPSRQPAPAVGRQLPRVPMYSFRFASTNFHLDLVAFTERQ